MPAPMQPLQHQHYYQSLSRNNSQSQLQQQQPSIWQRFPSWQESVIPEHNPQGSVQAQIHEAQYQGTTGTLTRGQDLQLFNCEFSSSGGNGTLPRPTATVKPLTPTLDNNNDVPVVCDDVCGADLPFANERLGTIRLKTTPEVFAEYEKEEAATKDESNNVSPGQNKNLLRTPTRAPNRSATDVMDDISSMLADLTTELDSMLSSDSIVE